MFSGVNIFRPIVNYFQSSEIEQSAQTEPVKAVISIENPDIVYTDSFDKGPEWKITLSPLNFDNQTKKLTFQIEYNGPKDAKISFFSDRGAMKSIPAQKILNVKVLKTEGEQESAEPQHVNVTIDFSETKYAGFHNWFGLVVNLYPHGQSFLLTGI